MTLNAPYSLLQFHFLSLSLRNLLNQLLHLYIQIRHIHSRYHCQRSPIYRILKLWNQPVQPHISGNVTSGHAILFTKPITAFLRLVDIVSTVLFQHFNLMHDVISSSPTSDFLITCHQNFRFF